MADRQTMSGWAKGRPGGGLREQGGHAVAEAVWIRGPYGAAPLEKSREVLLTEMNELLGVAAVEHCQQHQCERMLSGEGQVGVDFTRARERFPVEQQLVENHHELLG